MNTLFLWLLLPLLLGIMMLFFQHRKYIVVSLGIFISLALAITALLLPIEDVVTFGAQSFPLTNHVNVAGLQIILSDASRLILILFYGFLAFLFSGTLAAKTNQNFIPVCLIITPLIVTGISAKPIIYGFLFFQPAVFLSAFLLTPPESQSVKGVLRFLVYQVIGITFLLLAGWSISGGSELIENSEALLRALLFFWVGFSFLFAIFPLHSWVIMVAEGTLPYAAVFVFVSFFVGYSVILSLMLETYSWFFDAEIVADMFWIAGFILTITGGIGAAFQRNLGRLFGNAVIIEVGYGLLAFALHNSNLFYVMLLPRVFALCVWALGLSILRNYSPDLSFDSVKGIGRQFPLASSAIIIAQFSLAGVPLLAGFPLKLVMWKQISSFSTTLSIWTFLSSMCLLLGSLRSLSFLVTGLEELPWEEKEDNLQLTYLTTGIIILFLIGIFPHWINLFFTYLIEGTNLLNL